MLSLFGCFLSGVGVYTEWYRFRGCRYLNFNWKKGKDMRITILSLVFFMLSGCAISSTSNRGAPPAIDDFPSEEISFRVVGDNNTVLREIQDHLAVRGLPSIETVRVPKTFIVTTYIEEPSTKQDRRVRRTAFRFGLAKISDIAAPVCTSVSVVTLTKSRGMREELWSVQDQDVTYVSSAWPDLRNLFEKRACK
jgi:hypothetical protein